MEAQPNVQYLVAAPGPTGGSLFGKMRAACARNSGAAVAIIIVLLLLTTYLYARLRGWVGGEGFAGRSAARPKSKPATKKSRTARAKDAAADSEIDQLITEIEE